MADRMDDRGGRDAAGIGPYAHEVSSLAPISSLGDWKLAKGEPDIRGWEVQTVSGRQLGVVRDLLVDKDAREVVLLAIDHPGADRHSLVPIRAAQIDRDARVVLMDSSDLTAPDRKEVVVERAAVDDRIVERPAPAIEAADQRRTAERRINRLSTDI